MARIRLVAFDLDGTLVRGDTVCEVIARRLGHLDRMRMLEREASDAHGLIAVRSTRWPGLGAHHHPDGDLADIARRIVQQT